MAPTNCASPKPIDRLLVFSHPHQEAEVMKQAHCPGGLLLCVVRRGLAAGRAVRALVGWWGWLAGFA